MQNYKLVSAQQAKKILLEDENAILADVRDSQSYNESHDPASIHLTNKNVLEFMRNTDKGTPIILMCYLGNSSQVMAQYLVGQGFYNVYSINGGYEEWKEL